MYLLARMPGAGVWRDNLYATVLAYDNMFIIPLHGPPLLTDDYSVLCQSRLRFGHVCSKGD